MHHKLQNMRIKARVSVHWLGIPEFLILLINCLS